MSDLDLIREASNLAFRLRGEGDVEFSDLVPDWNYSDDDVARLWLIADEWRLAVEAMAKAIGAEWVDRWRERGRRGIEVDGLLVTTTKGSKYKTCNDPEGFWEEALTDPDRLREWFNPNQVRIGSIPQAVRDTFFDEGHRTKPDAVRQASAIPLEVLNDR